MKKHVRRALGILAVWMIGASMPAAQAPATRGSGHWEGAIQVPGQELAVQIDLSGGDQKWEGTIAIPAQSMKGFPIDGIVVEGDSVSFGMSRVPGAPTFKGTLSKDGQSISGNFNQGGGSMPFSLARKGDAKIEPAPKSTTITADLQGKWEGSLDVNGNVLRLVLNLSNPAGGPASGTLVSVDQGGVELPILAIVQTGTHLRLDVRAVAGNYEGDLKDGQLVGTWTQGGGTLPLTFKRSK